MTDQERDRVLRRIDQTLLHLLGVQTLALSVSVDANGARLDQQRREFANELVISTGEYLAKNLKPTGMPG